MSGKIGCHETGNVRRILCPFPGCKDSMMISLLSTKENLPRNICGPGWLESGEVKAMYRLPQWVACPKCGRSFSHALVVYVESLGKAFIFGYGKDC